MIDEALLVVETGLSRPYPPTGSLKTMEVIYRGPEAKGWSKDASATRAD
jgi:hypothetical protein